MGGLLLTVYTQSDKFIIISRGSFILVSVFAMFGRVIRCVHSVVGGGLDAQRVHEHNFSMFV